MYLGDSEKGKLEAIISKCRRGLCSKRRIRRRLRGIVSQDCEKINLLALFLRSMWCFIRKNLVCLLFRGYVG